MELGCIEVVFIQGGAKRVNVVTLRNGIIIIRYIVAVNKIHELPIVYPFKKGGF